MTKPLTVWDFSGPTGFSACALTIRYDDAGAASLGMAESDLKVFQYVGGTWQNITGSVDTGTNKMITASAKSPLTQIAVAGGRLARGTVCLLR